MPPTSVIVEMNVIKSPSCGQMRGRQGGMIDSKKCVGRVAITKGLVPLYHLRLTEVRVVGEGIQSSFRDPHARVGSGNVRCWVRSRHERISHVEDFANLLHAHQRVDNSSSHPWQRILVSGNYVQGCGCGKLFLFFSPLFQHTSQTDPYL